MYKAGGNEVVKSGNKKVEELLEELEEHMDTSNTLGILYSVPRGSQVTEPKPDGATQAPIHVPPAAPASVSYHVPTSENAWATYHPEKGPKWEIIQTLITENMQRPTCFNKHTIKQGCIPWTREEIIIVKYATASAKVLEAAGKEKCTKYKGVCRVAT